MLIRKLRAWRAPLAVLGVVVMTAAIFSIQLVSFNSGARSLGYSVSVRVQGFPDGRATTVALYTSAPTVQYAQTSGGVAVFDYVAPGQYTLYTDPNALDYVGISNIHVPAGATSVTLQALPVRSVAVAVTGTEAARVKSAVLLYNGQTHKTQRANIQNSACTLPAPAGTHTVQLLDANGSVIDSRAVAVTDADVPVQFVVGNPVASPYALRVDVTGGGSQVDLRAESGGATYSAKVVSGAAQFYNLPRGRYLVHAQGSGTAAYAVAQLPQDDAVSVQLKTLYNVDVDITGSRRSRAEYINYSLENRFMLYTSHDDLSSSLGDSVSLPPGSYTAYVYDKNKRQIERQSFRVRDRGIDVRIWLDSSSGSSSSGSSGSSGRWSGTATTSRSVGAPGALTETEAESATKSAVSDARRDGAETVYVRLKNVGSATRSRLRGLGENTAGLPVRLQADTMTTTGHRVEVRVTLDPSRADRNLNLYGATTGSDSERVRTKFRGWYTNRIAVVHLRQQSPWGQPVRIAALLDLAKFNTENLYLYSYSSETNSYKRIDQPDCYVDDKGYLHFTTEMAGYIIVSSGPLKKN